MERMRRREERERERAQEKMEREKRMREREREREKERLVSGVSYESRIKTFTIRKIITKSNFWVKDYFEGDVTRNDSRSGTML